MRRAALLMLSLALVPVPPLQAGTFDRTALAPEVGVDVLTRRVTREQLGRDLFANPYATVTIATVDVYDRFPYVETRHFQVVSDPRWNRLVFGERGRSLRAWDGAGAPLGPLSDPRGLAVDERNRVYVADTGNDRVVVLQATTELGEITLTPLFAIGGLGGPHDVAYSDGGTPFAHGDDLLYVADTGRNRIVALALEEDGARKIASLGELGSGTGRFAGPLALTVGRDDGAHTADVYVADAHNRRIVHLRLDGGRLTWAGEARQDATPLTSLATDQWGNVYAAAPQQGTVTKFSPALVRVAELSGDLARPRGFHVPFVTIRDHRDGRRMRVGQAHAVSVDQWSDGTGIGLWRLGVEIPALAVAGGEAPVAHFRLTDRAEVTFQVSDAASGRTLARRTVGTLPAGLHSVPLHPADLRGAPAGGELILRVTAASRYADGPTDAAQTRFHARGGGAALPGRPVLLGATPNPMVASARIAFLLPEAGAATATLGVFDPSGRRVRSLGRGFPPGPNEVEWDGTDDHGHPVRAGVYFYRLETGALRDAGRIVRVR